jgi:hypothetical protein
MIFLQGISLIYLGLEEKGKQWQAIAALLPSRTTAQVRSHAQKYLNKMESIK